MNRLYLIPAKPLARAKERLSGLLLPEERRRLTLAMLGDVVEVAASRGDVWVICSDADAARVAESLGAWPLPDATPDAGLNPSLKSAIDRALVARATGVAIVASDLACIEPTDLDAFPHGPNTLGIAPSASGSGTNILCLEPPDAIQPAFGENSRMAHEARGADAGCTVSVIERPRLALDVDRPEDLEAALALGAGPRTREVLGSLHVTR